MHHHHHHNPTLVVLSVVIAIFASYTALDLASSISISRGKARWLWLIAGSLAMGVGIWSMHFIGMLAFSMPGIEIAYDVPLLLLSIAVAVLASALALYLIATKEQASWTTYILGSLTMGTAIAGMHYIGIWSMEMPATIAWNTNMVLASIMIAVIASFGALLMAFKLRKDVSLKGFVYRGLGGILMGGAIAGMHYTGMAAMIITPTQQTMDIGQYLLATDNLATAVIIGTLIILSIALTGSNIDRALSRKTLVNDALREAIRARDEFMSVASHELRTPLTSIKLQNEMIIRSAKKEGADLSKLVYQLEKNDKNLIRINRLIEDMLDISRFTTGRLTLHKENFDLSLLVSEVLERLDPLLQEAGCTVTYQTSGPVEGEWDRFRLEQVFTNIITNAAKYAPSKPIEVNLATHNNQAIVKIKDHGKGVALKDQERIFKRFERADDSVSSWGMGLGLFIVREILNLHEGTVDINSEYLDGAEFIITLPRVVA